MPWLKDYKVYIQHDGARPHDCKGNDVHFKEEGKKDGWNIIVITQPAQSPDTNILDLGFFNALKRRAAHLKFRARNIDDLIEKISQAYNEYDPVALDHTWAHLFACYNEILRVDGGNIYKAPHIGARKRHKNSPSSVSTVVDVENYNRVYNIIYR